LFVAVKIKDQTGVLAMMTSRVVIEAEKLPCPYWIICT